jgi:hypothetical protein
LREVALPFIRNIMGVCKPITILILHQVTSRLVTPLKLIYSSIQVSNVLVLAVLCKLINFVFQTFPLFVPEMPAGFTSYEIKKNPVIVNCYTRPHTNLRREEREHDENYT